MKRLPKIDRREFLYGAGAGLALLNGAAEGQAQPPDANPFAKIRFAGIGIGSQGGSDIDAVVGEGATLVALCDVDTKYAAKKFDQYPNAKRYKDFRVMLEEMKNDLDAVVIGVPDHNHAVIALEAMKYGKHVYCEKPLAHNIHEVRTLMAAAKKYGVTTQLGNQGHSYGSIRQVVEWVNVGAVGPIHTVHAGCDAFKDVYCQERNLEKATQHYDVPPELDYELWNGPVEFVPYTPLWVPWNWRGWLHYGTGVIGDWFCHVVDPSFWALDLGAPVSVTAEVNGCDPVKDGLTYPPSTKITYEFAANKDRGPVTLIWHDGNDTIPKPENFPKDEEVPGTGAIMLGEKGMIVHGSHGAGACHILPESLSDQYKGDHAPKQTIERVKGHHWDWLEAIRTGRPAGSNFDYGGRLTQVALIGAISIRFPGQTLNWDDHACRFTNNDEANKYINPPYRKGWRLG